MAINQLITPDGKIDFGIYSEPVLHLNYMDYDLKTPQGISIPRFLKKIKFNQFHFVGIAGPELIVGVAVVDLKYAANGFFYVYDRRHAILTEEKKIALPNRDISISPTPEKPVSHFKTKELTIRITGETVIAKGKEIQMEVSLDTIDTTPLRICTRSGYRGWTFTQKTTPVKVSGVIECHGKKFPISSPASFSVIDWTGGFMRHRTFWNWAAGAALLPDGRTLGFNFACGTNETGFNENVFWVDGCKTEMGPVHFRFTENDTRAPWKIQSKDGKVELEFYPEAHRAENINAILLASKFTHLMGTFEGRITTNHSDVIFVKNCPGWAEDHYAKW